MRLDADDANSETILEDLPGDATRQELKEFLESLNEDEQASLIALAWIGRGTYAPGELDEAIATAKAEHAATPSTTSSACRSCPIISKTALDQLGYAVEQAEQEILRPS